jgi:prepilin-type N-terminal cleavage/methylation domain-containing protein
LVILRSVNAPKPGNIPFRVQRGAAFTLVEVLVVVALLAVAATAFLGGASNLFRAREPRADDTFWQAVNAARQLALESNQKVFLSGKVMRRPARPCRFPASNCNCCQWSLKI